MDKKLKSKVTSFQVLGTNPLDYSVVLIPYTNVSHCELCGSKLDYSFKLKHKDSNEKNHSKDVLVGSDCVTNFMETYFPLKKENIRIKMKELIEKTKSSIFLEENKNIDSIVIDIRTYFSQTLRKEVSEKSLMTEYYHLLRSSFYDKISKDLKSITRKRYLSKPKLIKIKKLHKIIKSKGLIYLLETAKIENSFKIKDKLVDDKKFYKSYFNFYQAQTIKESLIERTALNIFQKNNFYNRTKDKSIFSEIIKGIY